MTSQVGVSLHPAVWLMDGWTPASQLYLCHTCGDGRFPVCFILFLNRRQICVIKGLRWGWTVRVLIYCPPTWHTQCTKSVGIRLGTRHGQLLCRHLADAFIHSDLQWRSGHWGFNPEPCDFPHVWFVLDLGIFNNFTMNDGMFVAQQDDAVNGLHLPLRHCKLKQTY